MEDSWVITYKDFLHVHVRQRLFLQVSTMILPTSSSEDCVNEPWPGTQSGFKARRGRPGVMGTCLLTQLTVTYDVAVGRQKNLKSTDHGFLCVVVAVCSLPAQSTPDWDEQQMLSSSESSSQQDTCIPSFIRFLVKYANILTISDEHLSCVTVPWLAPPDSSHVYGPYLARVVLTSARNTPPARTRQILRWEHNLIKLLTVSQHDSTLCVHASYYHWSAWS